MIVIYYDFFDKGQIYYSFINIVDPKKVVSHQRGPQNKCSKLVMQIAEYTLEYTFCKGRNIILLFIDTVGVPRSTLVCQ